MKKLLAIAFVASMLFVIASPVFSHSLNQTHKVEVYKPEMVYINDALIPDVRPQYLGHVMIYSKDEKVKTVITEVTAKANSPPNKIFQGFN